MNELRAKVTQLVVQRARLGSRQIKILNTVLAIGAAAGSIAQFWTWDTSTGPTVAQVIGVVAYVMVFIIAVLIIFTDGDAASTLSAAQLAIAKAEEIEQEADRRIGEAERRTTTERDDLLRFLDGLPNIERNIALYQATKLMRDALEQASVGLSGDIDTLVSAMIQLASRSLLVASGFSLADQYTICVYRAVPTDDGGRFGLKLVDHLRAIPCAKEVARIWPEGQGVAGVSFSNASEIVIADLSDDSVQTIFQPIGLRREYDDDRYRSIVAVPILVTGEDRPWGVICATSDRIDHFNHDEYPGLKPEEAIRALADYTALAVAMMAARDRAKEPPPTVD